MYVRGQQRTESLLNGRFVECFHVIEHLRKIFVNSRIDMGMGYRAEFEHRFVTMRFTELKTKIRPMSMKNFAEKKNILKKICTTYLDIVYAYEVEIFFSGDHERGQIGSVYGQKHNGKHGPYIGHEPINEKRLHNTIIFIYRSKFLDMIPTSFI